MGRARARDHRGRRGGPALPVPTGCRGRTRRRAPLPWAGRRARDRTAGDVRRGAPDTSATTRPRTSSCSRPCTRPSRWPPSRRPRRACRSSPPVQRGRRARRRRGGRTDRRPGPDELAAALAALAGSPEPGERLGAAARERSAKYTWSAPPMRACRVPVAARPAPAARRRRCGRDRRGRTRPRRRPRARRPGISARLVAVVYTASQPSQLRPAVTIALVLLATAVGLVWPERTPLRRGRLARRARLRPAGAHARRAAARPDPLPWSSPQPSRCSSSSPPVGRAHRGRRCR